MAIPIKPTPVLKGKDAREFSKQIEETSKKSISKSELERLDRSYQKFKTLFTQGK